MDFIDIDLAGRTYKLRYTASDIQDVCRRLTSFQPVGAGKVTPVLLGNLLLNLDPDAFQFLIWAGLRHVSEFSKIDPADAQKILSRAIASGQQYSDLRRPIFQALIACGLADFSPIVKILEEAEQQQAQDGAIDVNGELREADSGNGSRPSSISLRPSSTPPSSPESSVFSTSRDG